MNIWSILLAIFLFGFMVFFHELGHFTTAKWAGVKVNEFSIGMGPKLFSVTKGETAYSLRLLPIGGFVAMEGEDEESDDEHCFMAVPVWKRIIITAAGGFMNLLFGLILVMILTFGEELLGEPVIAKFYENASSANYLEEDDRILAVNGEKVGNDHDIVYSLIRDQDGVVTMDVLRGEEKVHLDKVVFETEELENGQKTIVLDFTIYGKETTVPTALSYSFRWTWSLIKLVWHSLGDLITGNFTLNQLSGPVGITQVISQAASSANVDGLMLLLAMVTLNIGVFNLLPLPALDGGRIFFMIIEIFRGKPVNKKVEGIIHTVGLAVLMVLMLIVTANDIIKLVTGG